MNRRSHASVAATAMRGRPPSCRAPTLNAAVVAHHSRCGRPRCATLANSVAMLLHITLANAISLGAAPFANRSQTISVEAKRSSDVVDSSSGTAAGHKDIGNHAERVNETQPGMTQPGLGSPHAVSPTGFLGFENGTVSLFPSCDEACTVCFAEHYQGCLAFCSVGCEDYCEKKLPRPQCATQQKWVAQVGHVFEALNPAARMCKTTGVDGCPSVPSRSAVPTPVPYDPYTATETDGGSVIVRHRVPGNNDQEGTALARLRGGVP